MKYLTELNKEELQLINGGANGGLIWSGVIAIAGGIVSCCIPGGQVAGGIGIYTGTVTLIAGIAY